MTQSQLDRAVAFATGEGLATVRSRGFGPPADRLEPEDLCLAADCPFCGRPIVLIAGPGGLPPLAECPRCDVEFALDPAEVYPAAADAVAGEAGRDSRAA